MKLIIGGLFSLLLSFSNSYAQHTEWLLYARTIRDSQGHFRFDQNIVPNFRINNFLRAELGIRHGETTEAGDAYYHYKVEVQTKWLWNSVRFLTRLSDNIWKAPVAYSRSNYLLIAESRFPVAKNLSILLGAGAVATFQRDGVTDAAPSMSGKETFYPTYRVTIRYAFTKKWFVDAVFGGYDTFNPYPTNAPFLQIDSELELNEHVTLYGYLRYQYEIRVDDNLNDFLGLGVRLHR